MGAPAGRGDSRRLSVANAGDEIADLLADNPNLKTVIDEAMASAYRYARRKAVIETDMSEEAFPGNGPRHLRIGPSVRLGANQSLPRSLAKSVARTVDCPIASSYIFHAP
jgi:hypothetical protein